MAGRRAERVGRQVVQTLATLLESEVNDPRVRGVTLTAASASDDLRNVRVYWTSFGDAAAVAEAREGLAKAAGFLRRELARGMALRYVPSLSFEYDESIRRAERIEGLLRPKDEA